MPYNGCFPCYIFLSVNEKCFGYAAYCDIIIEIQQRLSKCLIVNTATMEFVLLKQYFKRSYRLKNTLQYGICYGDIYLSRTYRIGASNGECIFEQTAQFWIWHKLCQTTFQFLDLVTGTYISATWKDCQFGSILIQIKLLQTFLLLLDVFVKPT